MNALRYSLQKQNLCISPLLHLKNLKRNKKVSKSNSLKSMAEKNCTTHFFCFAQKSDLSRLVSQLKKRPEKIRLHNSSKTKPVEHQFQQN